CTGSVIFTSTKTVNGNGDYTSDPFTPSAIGKYRWTASFTPNNTNNKAVATACNDPNESVVVTNPKVSQITPTGTTCSDFKGGTAGTLGAINYTTKNGKISSTNPGVFFYYVKVTAPSSTFDIKVNETNDQAAISLFHAQNDSASQIILYDFSSCAKAKVTNTVTSTGPGTVTVHVSGATTGQVFILSIKYDAKTGIVNGPVPNPAIVNYTFNTPIVPGSSQGLQLKPQP